MQMSESINRTRKTSRNSESTKGLRAEQTDWGGWCLLQSREFTTARLKAEQLQLGPTPEQVHRQCSYGSTQRSKTSDGKAN